MEWNITLFNLLSFVYLNFFYVNVVGVITRRHTQTNLAQLQPNTTVGIRDRRFFNLADMRRQFLKELRDNLKEKAQQDVFKIEHANEMKQRFPNQQDNDYYFGNVLPIFNANRDEPTYVYLDERYYATLYNTYFKTPVYSAYTLRWNDLRVKGRKNNWKKNNGLRDKDQPSFDDYRGIQGKSLHRGHMYPVLYARNTEKKTYTFLITNTALQYASFNMNSWKRLELALYKASEKYCLSGRGQTYFLTGVIPSEYIPQNFFNHINIPEYFWTAVCCDMSRVGNENERSNGWSFAYIVKNENIRSSEIDMYFVQDFLQQIPYMAHKFRQFFIRRAEVRECLFNQAKTVEVIQDIVARNNKDTFFMKGDLSDFIEDKRVSWKL